MLHVSGQIRQGVQEANEALRNSAGLGSRAVFLAHFCFGSSFPKHPSTPQSPGRSAGERCPWLTLGRALFSHVEVSLHPTSVLENRMGQGRLSAPHSSHPHLPAIPNGAAASCLRVGNDISVFGRINWSGTTHMPWIMLWVATEACALALGLFRLTVQT